MPYDPNIHHRRSIRLRGYDYARAGAYFVTICAQGRECLFGEITDGKMQVNGYGEIVASWWEDVPRHFPAVELDAAIVMPNHFHGIIMIAEPVGAGSPRPAPRPVTGGNTKTGAVTAPLRGRPTLGQIVAYFKYLSTKHINISRGTPGVRIWQRNYYEHIIRNEADLCRIREYIANNPLKWELDQLHPANPSKW